MKTILLILGALALGGCSSSYTVKESIDEFSSADSRLIASENNRISSKSVAGGFHIDHTGVFVNPFIEVAGSGDVQRLGLGVVNKTDFTTTHGTPNSLGILRKITFKLSSGELMQLPIVHQSSESSDMIYYNSLAGYAGYDKWETGVAYVTRDQLQKLATAPGVACKIEGSKRSVIYNGKDISKSFLPNISGFYDQYVK